jgi:hypothetical protein
LNFKIIKDKHANISKGGSTLNKYSKSEISIYINHNTHTFLLVTNTSFILKVSKKKLTRFTFGGALKPSFLGEASND